MRDAGDQVALVLADQWLLGASGDTGARLLARVRELHPRAKRVLLIDWGAWRFEQTTEAIKEAMALGQIDYYLMKPWRSPDEFFHRTISEFLHEWSRARRVVRQEVEVVAQLVAARARAAQPAGPQRRPARRSTRRDSPAGRRLLAEHGIGDTDEPVVVPARGQAARGPDRTSELADAYGVSTQLGDKRDFDVIIIGAGPAGLAAAVYAASEGLRDARRSSARRSAARRARAR